MTSYRVFGDLSESEKEEFRSYLETTGTLDTLTKILVSLHEEAERPVDALSYLRLHLNTKDTDLKKELIAARNEIDHLKQEVAVLKVELAEYQAAVTSNNE